MKGAAGVPYLEKKFELIFDQKLKLRNFRKNAGDIGCSKNYIFY